MVPDRRVLVYKKTVDLLGFSCTTTLYFLQRKKEKEISESGNSVSGNSLLMKDVGGEWPDEYKRIEIHE